MAAIFTVKMKKMNIKTVFFKIEKQFKPPNLSFLDRRTSFSFF